MVVNEFNCLFKDCVYFFVFGMKLFLGCVVIGLSVDMIDMDKFDDWDCDDLFEYCGMLEGFIGLLIS